MKTETKSQKAIEPQKPDVLPHRVEGKEPKRFDSAPEKNPWKDGQAKNAKQAKRKERIAILQEMLAKAKQDEKRCRRGACLQRTRRNVDQGAG